MTLFSEETTTFSGINIQSTCIVVCVGKGCIDWFPICTHEQMAKIWQNSKFADIKKNCKPHDFRK